MPYTDLNGIIDIQTQYLSDLSGIPTSSGNYDIVNKIPELQRQLNAVYTKYQTNSDSVNDIIDHQSEMNRIIKNEKNRLDKKQKNVDDAVFSQRRILEFNESYRKRMVQYTKMVIVVIIALALIFGILILKNRFPMIPPGAFDLMMIIIIFISLIVLYLFYVNISARDNTDFDKLALNNPKILTADEIAKQKEEAVSSGNLFGTMSICVGGQCCNSSNGTVWDSGNSVCKANTLVQGFATLLDSSIVVNGTAKPYEPSEKNLYTKM